MFAEYRRVASEHFALVATSVIVVVAAMLLLMGQTLICKCGFVKVWHGVVVSSENSQHLSDWYTFSHIIHGFAFYAILWLIGRQWPLGLRFVIAVVLEGVWELFENTDLIINRYREVTISRDYYGDSVVNSVADILAMVVGFGAASVVPVWTSVVVVVGLEAFVAYYIRDNLTLNIIMLIYPLESIREWQAGG